MDRELFDVATFLGRADTPAVLLLTLCLIVAVVALVCIALLASVRSRLRQAGKRLDALHDDLAQTNRLLDKLTSDLDEYTSSSAQGSGGAPDDPFDEVAKKLDRLS